MFSVVAIDETDKWDNIVKSFQRYDVSYLNGYSRAFQIHGEGEPFLLFYNDGTTKAINVVMKRDIGLAEQFKGKLPLNTWFDLSTPYGYGGFLIEGEDYVSVNKAYDSFCRENGFVSEFVRFHILNESHDFFDGVVESHTRNVVRTLDLPIDEMEMDFEHKVRKNIKRANKAGLEVQLDESGERLNDFLDIYYATMKRANAREAFYFSEAFFHTLNKMKGNFVYVHVLKDNKVISTELILHGPENCYSFLGGTDHEYFSLRPNDFLKFEIIKWAKAKGLKRFVLGGGYGEDDGILKYKKSFAPNGVVYFYIGKKIYDMDKYDTLLQLRHKQDASSQLNQTVFFPAYRG